jgi:hypothetical protein
MIFIAGIRRGGVRLSNLYLWKFALTENEPQNPNPLHPRLETGRCPGKQPSSLSDLGENHPKENALSCPECSDDVHT